MRRSGASTRLRWQRPKRRSSSAGSDFFGVRSSTMVTFALRTPPPSGPQVLSSRVRCSRPRLVAHPGGPPLSGQRGRSSGLHCSERWGLNSTRAFEYKAQAIDAESQLTSAASMPNGSAARRRHGGAALLSPGQEPTDRDPTVSAGGQPPSPGSGRLSGDVDWWSSPLHVPAGTPKSHR